MKVFTLLIISILLNSCGEGEIETKEGRLKKDIKELNKKLTQKEETIKSLKSTKPLSKELDICKEKLTQSESNQIELKRQHNTQKETIKTINIDNTTLKQSIEEQSLKLQESKALIASLNQSIVEKDSKIEELINSAKTKIEQPQKNSKHIITINNKMWQDEPYTDEEKKAYTNDKNFGKAGDFKYATKYCKKLKLGGYNDWRLPTKDELQELYKNKSQLKNVRDDWYWTSTTYNEDSTQAWVVNFDSGDVYWLYKTSSNFVRCVR